MQSNPARLVFAGTPEFAAASLDALLTRSGYAVIGVYTQPDRPSGRGRQLKPSPVKELALEHGLTVFQPPSLRTPEAQAELAGLRPDLMIVAAYGLILPATVLDIPGLGCINVHASLLPRWRGAAPIERAIEAGDTRTGITIMQMDEGLDTGAMLLKHECAISDEDTGGSLRQRLGALGAEALLAALPGVISGTSTGRAQDATLATYASKLRKEEAVIGWDQPASVLARRIRAFNPSNVCHTSLGGESFRIHAARAADATRGANPGEILSAGAEGIRVACGEGTLLLLELQPAGGRTMTAAQLLNGRARLFHQGARFT